MGSLVDWQKFAHGLVHLQCWLVIWIKRRPGKITGLQTAEFKPSLGEYPFLKFLPGYNLKLCSGLEYMAQNLHLCSVEYIICWPLEFNCFSCLICFFFFWRQKDQLGGCCCKMNVKCIWEFGRGQWPARLERKGYVWKAF